MTPPTPLKKDVDKMNPKTLKKVTNSDRSKPHSPPKKKFACPIWPTKVTKENLLISSFTSHHVLQPLPIIVIQKYTINNHQELLSFDTRHL